MAKTKQQSTELTLVQQPEVKYLIQKSGIELTKAEAHVMAFSESFHQLAELSRPLADLNKENPTKEDAKIARENRLKLVTVRTGAGKIKDNRKKDLLLETGIIQDAYNLLTKSSQLTENQYEEIEKFQEKLDTERRNKLFTERVEILLPFEVDTEFLPLDIMDEDKFQTLLAKSKESFEAVTAARKKAETDRIEAERLAEEKRIADELAEQERIKVQAVENERLKKEAEAREKELAKERAENEKKAKETEVLRQQEQAKADAILKAEREAREKVEAELEAKRLQEETEKQQAIAEQNERDAAAKALLLAPDQDKVKAFYAQFIALQFPDLESEAGKRMTIRVKEALSIVKQVIIDDSKTLL